MEQNKIVKLASKLMIEIIKTDLPNKEINRLNDIVGDIRDEAINYTRCCKSDSELLPSFLYKSDGGLYFKHREKTDVTKQWNEYLKTR